MKEIIRGITTRYIFRNSDKKSVQLDVTVYDAETASNVKVHDIVLHVDGIEMNYNYNNTNGPSCIYGKCNTSIHEMLFSNVEKITSAILPWASNILFTHLPFRLFSNLFSVTMLALLLRISSKIAQKCRYKIVELILSTLLNNKGEGRIKIRTKIGDEYLIAIPEDISSDIYNSLKNNDK